MRAARPTGPDRVPTVGAVRISDWRRAREVLDAYDGDRVLSEVLADDLVNDLASRAVGGRRRSRAGLRAGRPPGRPPWLVAVAP